MKKSIILFALALGTTGAYAQDLTSKKGEPILPEAEDWSIGVDATPFLEYAGNFFGKSGVNPAPTFNFLNGGINTITGRYMKDAQNAYRGALRIGFGGNTKRGMIDNRMVANPSFTANGFPAPTPAMVENSWKHSATTIGLSGGIEKRKGKTRLQGYYGGEVGIYVSMSKDKFEYGNKLTTGITPAGNPNEPLNVNPESIDNMGTMSLASGTISANNTGDVAAYGINGAVTTGGVSGRVTERKNGTTFGFGVRGFIGAEYFILPKMSLGGEFGWGLGISNTGASTTTWEMCGRADGSAAATTNSVATSEIKGSKNGGWALDTDNKNTMWAPSGVLRLNLYF